MSVVDFNFFINTLLQWFSSLITFLTQQKWFIIGFWVLASHILFRITTVLRNVLTGKR